MFLRPYHLAKDGKDHTYWSLVETVRTPDGPGQRTVCYRGELNHSAQTRWLKTLERELLQDGWIRVRDEVEAKLVPMPTGTETYVLCRSTARREREGAIRRRFSARMERALKHLAQQVDKGQLKDRQKIERRLGKIQARHPPVAGLYAMGVTEREGRLAVEWELRLRRITEPTREQKHLLHHLRITRPERPELALKCSENSAIA